MKKWLSLALAMILLCSMLAACGGGTSSSGATSGGSGAENGRIRIEFWVAQGKTAISVLEGIIADFNASQDVYEVVPIVQADYDETYQKLQAGIAGNNAPPLALLDSDKAYSLQQKGLLTPFDDLLAADETFDRADYIDVFFDQGVNEAGQVFAMPAYGTTQVMYGNIEAFANADIDMASIATWQDLEAAATAMTVRENGETTFYGWEPMWKRGNLIDAAFSNGAQMFSEDMRTVTINSPEWVEVWDSFRQWIHEDEIMRIHFGGQGWEYWYKTMDDVLQGRAGGYTGSSGDQADLDFSIVQAFEQPGWGTHPSAPVANVLQLVMPKSGTPEQQQGAYEFARFYSSPEMQVRWTQGTGYVMVRASAMELPEFVAYAEENPQALVPVSQAMHGSLPPRDPTGNQVYAALDTATDQVEIDNIPAQQALDEAQEVAQQALDEYWANQE